MISAVIYEEKDLEKNPSEIENLKKLILNLSNRGLRNIYLILPSSVNFASLELKRLNFQIILYYDTFINNDFFRSKWYSFPDDKFFFVHAQSKPSNFDNLETFLNRDTDYTLISENSTLCESFLIKKSLLLQLKGSPFKAISEQFYLENKPKDKIFSFTKIYKTGKANLRCSNKLTISRDQKFFGPGVKNLLDYIERTGSVKSAAERMNISYSKAWKMINTMEEELQVEIVTRNPGGFRGGESHLTEYGKNFLRKYERFTIECDKFMLKIFQELFQEDEL